MIDSLGEGAACLAAVFGGGIGLYAMINPAWARAIVRLEPAAGSVEGRSEFRATMGGLFLFGHAFGLILMLTGAPEAPAALAAVGMGWLGAAVGRSLSMALDAAATRLNAGNVAIELAMGLALVWPFLAGS